MLITPSSFFLILFFLTNLGSLAIFFKVERNIKIYFFSLSFLFLTTLIPFILKFETLWSVMMEDISFSDTRYIFLNILFSLIPNIYLVNFIMQMSSGLLLTFVIRSIYKEGLFINRIDNLKLDYYIFIIMNYIIILLSKMYTYHIRQYWSCAIFIFLFYVISKNKKIFFINNFSLSLIGASIHPVNIPSFLIVNLILLKKYFIKKIKVINYKLKSNLESKYLFISLFLIALFIIINYFEPIFIFLVKSLSPKEFAQGYLIPKELGVTASEKSRFGFILPILYLLPILIMANTLPFSNLVTFINQKRELVLKNINILSSIIIFISIIEYFTDFYAIGRMKTVIYPLIFYLLFNLPLNQLRLSNLKFASIIVFILSIYTTLNISNLK